MTYDEVDLPSLRTYNARMNIFGNIRPLPSDEEYSARAERERLRYNRIILLCMTAVFLFGVCLALILIDPAHVKAALDAVRALPSDATLDEVEAAVAVYHAELLCAAVRLLVHAFLGASVTFACYVVFRKY